MAKRDERDEQSEAQEKDGVHVSVGGSVGGSLTVAGRDVIQVIVQRVNALLPPWLQIGVTTLVALAALAILTLTFLIYTTIQSTLGSPLPSPPEPEALAVVGQSDLAVTALAIDRSGDRDTLWVGAESKEESSLYRLDVAEGAEADLKHVMNVSATIIGIATDCKGNLWLLSEEGARVYSAQTGEKETLLNSTTTEGWLNKNTSFAVASRCPSDDTAEVWLAREGVHTLRYASEYPTYEDIELVPSREDDVFLATQANTLGDVRALAYEPEGETLWVAGTAGKLLSISFRGVYEPEIQYTSGTSIWSLSLSPESDLWAGTSEFLVSVEDGQEIDLPAGGRALVVAAGEPWIWAGDRCADASADCAPLMAFAQGQLSEVALGGRDEVRALAIDSTGAVWIGTEAGLILYGER